MSEVFASLWMFSEQLSFLLHKQEVSWHHSLSASNQRGAIMYPASAQTFIHITALTFTLWHWVSNSLTWWPMAIGVLHRGWPGICEEEEGPLSSDLCLEGLNLTSLLTVFTGTLFFSSSSGKCSRCILLCGWFRTTTSLFSGEMVMLLLLNWIAATN